MIIVVIVSWVGSAVIASIVTYFVAQLKSPILCMGLTNEGDRYFLNGSSVTAYDVQIFDPHGGARWTLELVGALLPGEKLYFSDLRDDQVMDPLLSGRLHILYRRSPSVSYVSTRSRWSLLYWLQSFWTWVVDGSWRPITSPTFRFSQRVVFQGLERRRWFRSSSFEKLMKVADKETPTP